MDELVVTKDVNLFPYVAEIAKNPEYQSELAILLKNILEEFLPTFNAARIDQVEGYVHQWSELNLYSNSIPKFKEMIQLAREKLPEVIKYRKNILKAIEEHRTVQKKDKESSWTAESKTECSNLYKTLKPKTETHSFVSFLEEYFSGQTDCVNFLKPRKRIKKQNFHVYIFELEESILRYSEFSNITQMSRHFNTIVDVLDFQAKHLFKYHEFDAPLLDYYKPFDDQKDLSKVDFSKKTQLSRTEISHRLRKITQICNNPDFLQEILPSKLFSRLKESRSSIDRVLKHWNSETANLLRRISLDKNSVAVVVSGKCLVDAVADCLAFGLFECFPPSRLYSSKKKGLDWTLNDIQKRYGNTTQFSFYAYNKNVETACKKNNIPFRHMSVNRDLERLKRNLQ